ncbi:MAG: WYL domain-containing protein [Clostridia bacterium]|nr:WYL domain-containing protein [Clostridia bacterium]
MARSDNQKLKILHLMRLLMQGTDEAHPLGMNELIAELTNLGIKAERKSVYADMEALKVFGLDIGYRRTAPKGYYVASREFEPPELKLLVDSVQASKFITERKSAQLIKKLISLGSVYEAQLINRQVYVKNRVKSMNESIYYNVDKIHGGIVSDRQISFKYFEYGADKRKRYRRGGERYTASPFALTWDDENYYMIAYDSEAGMIKHYRVDKMDSISPTDKPRLGAEAFADFDMAAYSKRMFSMFGGQEETVTLKVANELAGVVIDRFGKDASLLPLNDCHFILRADVAVSRQFFGWLCGLGEGVRVLSPKKVAEDYREHLSKVLQAQGEQDAPSKPS